MLFDNEKPKFIFFTILLPIIGAIITIVKTSNSIKLRDKELQNRPHCIKKGFNSNNYKIDIFENLID